MSPSMPSLFVFFFQLINNWPKLAIFMYEQSTKSVSYEVKIAWDRQRLYHFTPFLNTVEEFLLYYGRTKLSVCESFPQRLGNISLLYKWTIYDGDMQKVQQFSSRSCKIFWNAAKQGCYKVTVNGKSLINDNIIVYGKQSVQIKDYWIAAIGDSFASGEGNPDVPANIYNTVPAQWLSELCHRSSRSWAYKVYQKIYNATKGAAVHFSYLPCSGASVDNGIVSSSFGDSQLAIIERISKLRGSGPELMLMSAGGNDIGYSEILSTLSWGETEPLFSSVDMRFFYVSHQLDKLAERLRGIKPRQVIITHYFDLSRNDKGEVDANCPSLRQISTRNLVLAERKILQRINKLISKKAREQSWTAVEGVPSIFRSKGLCSSKPLIRSVEDSLRIQGNSLGAFHPVEEAHTQIAQLVFKQVQKF